MFISPSGFYYGEFYLYSQKQWEMIPSGVSSYVTASGMMQNAPVIITSSGLQETQPSDPFARYDGLGKYNKVGFGGFTLSPSGTPQVGTNQFCLHPQASGYILFANPLSENVYVEYEGGTSSYYVLTSMDINPMRNQFSSGFISCSPVTVPYQIIVSSTNSTLTSNGSQKTNILATMLDENGDGCPGQQLIFWIPGTYMSYILPIDNGVIISSDASGNPSQIMNMTNSKGQARCSYWPNTGQTGSQAVYASYLSTSNAVFGYVVITQTYTVGNPFTLDSSNLDGIDYLT